MSLLSFIILCTFFAVKSQSGSGFTGISCTFSSVNENSDLVGHDLFVIPVEGLIFLCGSTLSRGPFSASDDPFAVTPKETPKQNEDPFGVPTQNFSKQSDDPFAATPKETPEQMKIRLRHHRTARAQKQWMEQWAVEI